MRYVVAVLCGALGLTSCRADPAPAGGGQPGTAPDQRNPSAEQRKPGEYPLTADSLPQADAPKGRLEGPFPFESRIITNTVRRYWIFVPAQYTPDKPASVLVFQDGQRATNP